jgi:molecular chaperone GrpE (heat shock protein)
MGQAEVGADGTPAEETVLEAPDEGIAEPAAEPEASAILTRLDELQAAIERTDGRIAERDRLAVRDRDLIDRLHAENQRLRSGEAFALIAPVARDLVRLRDQLLQLDAASPEPGRSDAALIEPQLLGMLARLGVEPYEPEEGDTFDAARHQGVGRTPTSDSDLDGRVAAVRREGFTAPDGRPLRAAEVEVWHHVPTDPGSASPGPRPASPLGGS